jgi:hypothetical protein
MFRKIILSFIILTMSLFLTSCYKINLDEVNMIKSPSNNMIPVEGVWTVEGYEKLKEAIFDEKELKEWLGKKFQFFKEEVKVGNESYKNPTYKVKRVNAKQFFLYEYGMDSSKLGIESEDVEVVTLLSEDKLLYDIVKLKDELYVSVNNILLKLTFYSKDKYLENIKNTMDGEVDNNKVSIESDHKSSGVLIGLRYTEDDKNTGNESIKYRTLWIESKYSSEYPAIQSNDVLVPRMSGFWQLGSTRFYKDGNVYDLLNTSSLNRKDSTNKSTSSSSNKTPRIISYVGNDYVVSEYSPSLKTNSIEYSHIQVLPIDIIGRSKGIKLQDIAGESGDNALINSAKAFLGSLSSKELQNFGNEPKEEDFFLLRRNGHWILSGRLFGKDAFGGEAYKNYDISLIPPKALVSYDDLKVSWNSIKEKNPDAIDAYTSPNEDMALVLTKESIYVYSINKGKLSDKYLGKIKLKTNETVIMSEWATTDNFVNAWRKTIKSITGSKIAE